MNNTSSTISTINTTGEMSKAKEYLCSTNEFTEYHKLLTVLAVLIVTVNLCVFFFISCSRLLKKHAGNLILIGLSLNDAITGMSIFIHLFPHYFTYQTCTTQIAELLRVLFIMGYFTTKINFACSVGHLLLLSCERMVAFFMPLRYKYLVVNKRVLPAVASVWVFSIAFVLVEFSLNGLPRDDRSNKIYTIVDIVIFVLIPMVLLWLQYSAMLIVIYRFQKSHKLNGRTVFKKHKPLFIYFVMFLSFLLLTVPFMFGVKYVMVFEKALQKFSQKVLAIIIFLRFLPSLINPFLYALFKDDFRKNLNHLRRRYTQRKLSESETLTFKSRISESRRSKKYSPRKQQQINEQDVLAIQ